MGNGAKKQRALVTGASGFVGSHLADHLLAKGYQVRCLVRRTSNLKYIDREKTELVFGGLDSTTDWEAVLEGVDVVYHVAGLTFARRPQQYFEVNQKGTEAILSAVVARRKQITRFVHISSLAAAGPSRDGEPLTEEAETRPISPYGRSKLLSEEAVRAASDIVSVTIIRPPAVYGPRDYAIYEFFKSIARGLAPKIGSGDMRVSLVNVTDLVEGTVLAGESQRAEGRTYFISSEDVYMQSEVNDLLMKIIGRQARRLAIPRAVAYGVALAAEGVAAVTRKPPVINRDKVRDLSQRYWVCSVDAAKRDFGYKQKVPLEAGLNETYHWYVDEGWLSRTRTP